MAPNMQPPEPSESENRPQLLINDNLTKDWSKTILVAEDNTVNQRIATLLLEKLGLKAQIVENGLQAVEAVRHHDYPVVLMDCHMPEMDGFEATRAIRRIEMVTGKHTPIIAVTALAMAGDRERCIEAGMDDYIPKPIDRERLKNKLNQWMQNEFAFHNQKLAEKFFAANVAGASFNMDPIDLAELEVFYGSMQEAEELIQLFLKTTERQLPELDIALSEHRDKTAARMAHELKGASASIGAKAMSLLCLQLEQAIGQQDWEHCRSTYENIVICFDRLKDFVVRAFRVSSTRTLQS